MGGDTADILHLQVDICHKLIGDTRGYLVVVALETCLLASLMAWVSGILDFLGSLCTGMYFSQTCASSPFKSAVFCTSVLICRITLSLLATGLMHAVL